MAQQHNQKTSSEQGLEHKRILDAGLKLLSADDLKPSTPCPDSWTFALYVQGQVDEQTRRTINSHIALCSECYREYLALAEPEDVMKEVDRELHSTSAAPAERSPDAWRRLMEQLRSFVIDLGKTYGKDVMVGSVRILAEASAVGSRGKRPSLKLSKLLEANVGDNTYSIELGVQYDGSLQCDIDGEKVPHQKSLRVVVRRESGEALHATETNIHGNVDFVLPTERVPTGVMVLDLHLNGYESQLAFSVPS
ncbi:MAG: hypothetical protein WAQ52_03640 [Terriglobales bacterium]